MKWIEWENRSLEILLMEEKLNLVKNFSKVVNLLRDIPVREYEFENLDPIILVEDDNENTLKKLG